MALYTVQLAEMLAAHANIEQLDDQQKTILKDPYTNREVVLEYANMEIHDSNDLIDHNARSFFDKHVKFNYKNLKITDNNELNDAIYTQFCQAFFRQFWNNEIGQENPLNFLVLLRNFCEKHLPIWAQGYKQLFVDNLQWTTNVSDSTSKQDSTNDTKQNSKSAGIAGVADTPQNELNFKIKTGDPTEDYNFNFASNVSGNKSTGETTGNATGNVNTSTHTEGRNAIITDLLDRMLQYTDGIYFDLFTKAKNDMLFMLVY